ncbi:MAG: alpha-1,3-fucosyltransferase [Acidobacteria bacterium]|nr:alpha-1,3-fucosyltransferase [Acidobacteriota bacterium]
MRILSRLGRTAAARGDGTLILFHNTMWGSSPLGRSLAGPATRIVTSDRRHQLAADAVVFHIPTLRRLPRHKPAGQIWVAWSLESEVNYPQLRDPSFTRHFDLTATYRRDSDVPLSYVSYYSDSRSLARALVQPPARKSPDRTAVSLISSRIDRSGRLEYADELMRFLDVHSFGRFRRNRRLIDDRGRPSKLDLIAGYKFTLAFENAIDRDYVTEKFFDPLVAGSVPVYMGAPNVEDFAPGDCCYISTRNFGEPRDLATFLRDLGRDDIAYRSYMDWKRLPLRPAFEAFLESQSLPFLDRLFDKVEALRRAAG